MTNVQFSWSDSFHAALHCLPCLKSSSAPPSDDEDDTRTPRPSHFAHAIPPPRARPDELEGLLADAHDDSDALSLHTNPGDRRRPNKPKRRRPPKNIRVFGFDLFGRAPAIQLPESDDENNDGWGTGGMPQPEPRPRTISSSTLDSDAAPLDPSAIEELSAARTAAALAREDEQRREKEERRRRRRERKELKRAAMARALELQAHGDDEFEGFQGSGPAMPSFSHSVGSATNSGSMSITSSQEFGPFAHGQPVEPFDADAALAADEADGADFGGESYTSRPRAPPSGTRSTSDTRSTSTGTGSNSNGYARRASLAHSPAPYNHQFLTQAHTRSPLSPVGSDASLHSATPSPLSPDATAPPPPSAEKSKKRHRSKSVSKLLSASASNSTTGSSSQLASPPPSAHPPSAAPRVAGEFEGFVGDFGGPELVEGAIMGDVLVRAGAQEQEQEARKSGEYTPLAGFSSVGSRGIGRRNSEMGVFLARRGDD